MKNCCIDEKQIEVMKGGLQDAGKWIYYILKAARVANVPWTVLKEGIRKVGAYDAYALYPRTNDLKALAEAVVNSDMVKAHDGRILHVDDDGLELELGCDPMLEMACTCTDDPVLLQDLSDAYLCVFEGIFETYGLRCVKKDAADGLSGRVVLAVSR
ncbi:hypothetical protein [Diplocloster agilis]|uniref:hypothetical protein n=1 Tax=Diplocloster agilis TaxID=2850323 RepID=UPI000822630C|nr:hypothetical protein [Suonthocola fibrivorans]MCU6736172.1 hypothetical protein [Suonthocola fibrivorans]SCJ87271.1 Uncharacterised protein [uncultured Clostridium sp.]